MTASRTSLSLNHTNQELSLTPLEAGNEPPSPGRPSASEESEDDNRGSHSPASRAPPTASDSPASSRGSMCSRGGAREGTAQHLPGNPFARTGQRFRIPQGTCSAPQNSLKISPSEHGEQTELKQSTEPTHLSGQAPGPSALRQAGARHANFQSGLPGAQDQALPGTAHHPRPRSKGPPRAVPPRAWYFLLGSQSICFFNMGPSGRGQNSGSESYRSGRSSLSTQHARPARPRAQGRPSHTNFPLWDEALAKQTCPVHNTQAPCACR